MARVLIIESDDIRAMQIHNTLQKEGFFTDRVKTAKQGINGLQKYVYDVAVIAWTLPDTSCDDLCKRIANTQICLPIVVLGTSNSIDEKVSSLDAGAQDFIDMPGQLQEIGARVRSILRRYGRKSSAPVVLPASAPVNVSF